MDEDRRIATLEEVPDESTLLATVRVDGEREEIILLRHDDEVVAYENFCPHLTDVRLDKGSGASVRNEELVCTKHGATFEPDSGHCNFGPCEGAYLTAVDVVVDDGVVFLADADYEFVERGAMENGDLSTAPNERLGF